MEDQVGELEKREIRDQVDRVLRDLGFPEPPLKLEDVRKLLSLDLSYYSSSDPGLVSELSHRFTLLARKTIPDIGKRLQDALSKSKLCAFWVPDASKILIDEDVPVLKHRWIEGHEICHSITPWHKEFLLGDNAQTLDPACHAMLETEANYGAARLLFLQDKFSNDARDLELSFDSIKLLAKRYKNSILSTFWRAVEDRDQSMPVFGMVSVHPIYPEIGKHDGPTPWRNMIRSAAFRTQFSNVSPDDAYKIIVQNASFRKTGPIFSTVEVLPDVLGVNWEFQIECFSTKYSLLTLGFPVRKHTVMVAGEFIE